MTQSPLLESLPSSTALPDKHQYWKACPPPLPCQTSASIKQLTVCTWLCLWVLFTSSVRLLSFFLPGPCFSISTVGSQLGKAGHASSSQFSRLAWLSLCSTCSHPCASFHRRLLIGGPAPRLVSGGQTPLLHRVFGMVLLTWSSFVKVFFHFFYHVL